MAFLLHVNLEDLDLHFGGPEVPNFGPMDGPVRGMQMGFPGRPPVSNGRMPPARNGMIMGPPPAMMGGSLMMGTAGRPLHLPMARGPFRPAFGPGRKGQ